MAVKPVPDHYPIVTPYLCIKGAAEAIEFYKKAFGAVERMRMLAIGTHKEDLTAEEMEKRAKALFG